MGEGSSVPAAARHGDGGARGARIVAIDEPTPMRGSVSFLVEDDALVAPIDEAWDAER